MAKRTKKVGSAGRFGVRGGRKIRGLITQIEKEQKKRHTCPNCKKSSVKRLASGIWECKACKTKFTGGAYVPEERIQAGK